MDVKRCVRSSPKQVVRAVSGSLVLKGSNTYCPFSLPCLHATSAHLGLHMLMLGVGWMAHRLRSVPECGLWTLNEAC